MLVIRGFGWAISRSKKATLAKAGELMGFYVLENLLNKYRGKIPIEKAIWEVNSVDKQKYIQLLILRNLEAKYFN